MNRFNATCIIAGLYAIFFAASSCKRERLFVQLDSLSRTPSQVHFFNNFPYDFDLNFTIDGVLRQAVTFETFSNYYPTVNKFNSDGSGNVKGFVVQDKLALERFVDTSFFQFSPNVSYLAFTTYATYITGAGAGVNGAKEAKRPTLVFVKEDLNPPYDGLVKFRFVNVLSGPSSASLGQPYIKTKLQISATLTLSPDQGSGTRKVAVAPSPFGIPSPVSAYQLTQPGKKTLSLASNGFRFTFSNVVLDPNKSYSLMATGDLENYILGREPVVKLFIFEEGRPETLKPLVLSSVQKINAAEDLVSVRVTDAAYNVPDTVGPAFGGRGGLNVIINGLALNVEPSRALPGGPFGSGLINVLSYGGVNTDDAGLHGGYNVPVNTQRNRFFVPFAPVIGAINVRSMSTTDPFFNDAITADFEAGKVYSLFLVPRTQHELKCDIKIVENDLSVNPDKLKFRVANLLWGGGGLDLRLGDENGKVLIEDVPFGDVSKYLSVDADPAFQRLVLTKTGTNQNVFGSLTAIDNKSFNIPFKGGNNGTLVVSGSVLPTRITERGNLSVATNTYYYLPTVQYLEDAYFFPDNGRVVSSLRTDFAQSGFVLPQQ